MTPSEFAAALEAAQGTLETLAGAADAFGDLAKQFREMAGECEVSK